MSLEIDPRGHVAVKSGHDDTVMARSIALAVVDEKGKIALARHAQPQTVSEQVNAEIREFLRNQEAERRTAKMGFIEDVHMGAML